MYSLLLNWKSFKVDLPSMESWLRNSAVGSFLGGSADMAYHLWFSEEPSENVKAMVQQHWDSLSEQSESAKIALREQRARTVAYAKANLPYIPMGQWSPAEIKLFMGQILTYQDEDSLIAKYPNI